MGGKRQLEIRQIRVLRGGKRQGPEPIKIRKEKKISKGAAMPMACSDFWFFLVEGGRGRGDIFRTLSLDSPVVSA